MTIKVTWKGDEEKHRMLDWGGVAFAPGKPETLPDGFDPAILAKMRKNPLFEVSEAEDKPAPAPVSTRSAARGDKD